jgi:hypothetical protein
MVYQLKRLLMKIPHIELLQYRSLLEILSFYSYLFAKAVFFLQSSKTKWTSHK